MPFTPPKPIAPTPDDMRGSTVLVVDDERAWRVILETDLKMLGYKVSMAEDADQALIRAQADEPEVAITRVDPAVLERQRARLAELRGRRDAARATKARADLVAVARGSANLVPLIVTAVEAGVTLGEICADLRGVFGTYVPPRL